MPRDTTTNPGPRQRKPHVLEESERQAVTHALRVAAERFKADAARTREAMTEFSKESFGRVAEQFDRQSKEAASWADRFENADEITVLDRAPGRK